MKLTWLGQVGLAVESGSSLLLVDPYLADTLSITAGPQFNRMVAVDESWLQTRPDVVLLTHDHGDHTDMPSLEAVITEHKPVEILAGVNAWHKIRGKFPGTHNYIMMKPGNEWTTGPFHIRAVTARHSDETAVGYVISAEDIQLVISGDTLYCQQILDEIGPGTDILFVVMNGKGNNMNCIDAARYAEALAPRVAIPVHWGLFEKFSDDPHCFAAEAAKRGVRSYVAAIYEPLDTSNLSEEVK